MKKKCDIIRDLLPLYAENMCSDMSRDAVAEHISDCAECRDELKKINTGIVIKADADISAFRKIKKRALVQKIVISFVSAMIVFIGLWFLQFYLINTDCTMDYEKYHLSENVWVDEDEDGNLWICKKDNAANAYYIMPTVSDANGKHMPESGFDPELKKGYGFTLKQRKIDSLSNQAIEVANTEERSLLFNKNEKEFEYIFYYDDTTNTEYILWERN